MALASSSDSFYRYQEADSDDKWVALFLEPFTRFAEPVQDLLGPSLERWSFVKWGPTEGEAVLLGASGGRDISVVVGAPSSTTLERLPRLKLLQIPYTGVDGLAIDKVPVGCSVCNVHGMDQSIAEYVIGNMLDWVIGFSRYSAEFMADGVFQPPFPRPGYKGRPFHGELCGKTLGIVGFGAIGAAVAKRAVAFDMRVIATTRTQRAQRPLNVSWIGSSTESDLEKLLQESDFVLIACPLSHETRGLVDADRLKFMKKSAVLINVARGAVVDEDALWNALKSEQIAGAIIDVWWAKHSSRTPSVGGYAWHSLTNVVMTPHCSGWTAEAEDRRVIEIAGNLDALATGTPLKNVLVSA